MSYKGTLGTEKELRVAMAVDHLMKHLNPQDHATIDAVRHHDVFLMEHGPEDILNQLYLLCRISRKYLRESDPDRQAFFDSFLECNHYFDKVEAELDQLLRIPLLALDVVIRPHGREWQSVEQLLRNLASSGEEYLAWMQAMEEQMKHLPPDSPKRELLAGVVEAAANGAVEKGYEQELQIWPARLLIARNSPRNSPMRIRTLKILFAQAKVEKVDLQRARLFQAVAALSTCSTSLYRQARREFLKLREALELPKGHVPTLQERQRYEAAALRGIPERAIENDRHRFADVAGDALDRLQLWLGRKFRGLAIWVADRLRRGTPEPETEAEAEAG